MNDFRQAEALFADHPNRLRLFRLVRDYIESLGSVELKPSKMQVGFRAQRQFAWAWLPIRVTPTRPEDCILLSFGLDHRIEDRRITESTEGRPNSWTHHVILVAERDFDAKVKGWLKEAHAEASVIRKRAQTKS